MILNSAEILQFTNDSFSKYLTNNSDIKKERK